MHATEHVWRPEDNPQELVFSFHCACFEEQTRIISLSSYHLYLLTRLPTLQNHFFFNEFIVKISAHPFLVRVYRGRLTGTTSIHPWNYSTGFLWMWWGSNSGPQISITNMSPTTPFPHQQLVLTPFPSPLPPHSPFPGLKMGNAMTGTSSVWQLCYPKLEVDVAAMGRALSASYLQKDGI